MSAMDDGHGQHQPHVDPLLPGYVLDALDAAEQRTVVDHLYGCRRCRRAADQDRAVAAQIAFAAPRYAPLPHLKHRLMARLAREGARAPDRLVADTWPALPMAPAGRRATARVMPARPRFGRLLVAAAMLPWLLAALLGALLADALQRQPASIAVAAVAGAHGIYGWVVMAPGGTNGRLMLTHLPPLPPGQRYVCWLQNERRTDRACVFRPPARHDAATVPVSAPQPLDRYARITVTIEKGAPSPRLSGTLLASGSLR